MYIIPKIASSVLNYSRNNVAPSPLPPQSGYIMSTPCNCNLCAKTPFWIPKF